MQFRKCTRMPLDTYFLHSLTSLILPLLTEQEALEKVFQNLAQASQGRVLCPPSLVLSLDLPRSDHLIV